jgi:Tol biopolymer transport system component
MRCRGLPAGLACAASCLVGLFAPGVAGAFYGNGAELVSADYERLEQGDDTTVFAAISADGRYVVMQTRARNFFDDDDPDPPGRYRAGGLFRFELATKELEKVADGDLFDEASNAFVRRGASQPSVSADGRFVAFATAESLIAEDVNDNVDVYVRDMTIPISDPGAFELISARDGGDEPASYGPPPFPFPGSNPGADVSRGVAISADGRRVAFRTDVPSDLPASPTADVPAGQVFLRDRALQTTTLVTRTESGGGPAGGAIGAALSADGTTVAWTGRNAAAQTPFLDGENDEPSILYYLWQRVADGPGAPTRRITGVADPDDPACPPEATTVFDQFSTGPCYGPLTDQEDNRTGIDAQIPALSGDGNTVAFLTGSGPRPLAFTGAGLDLYLTEMTPGRTRKETTVELTRDPATPDPAASPPISSLAMSSGGRYLAMATARTSFALPALRLITNPRTVPGVRELYVVDLQRREIDRVTRSTSGGDINSDVQNGLTITGDGDRVAFTSFAGNLFFGDANQRADAFVATREEDPGTGGAPPDDDPPPPPEEPRLTVAAEPGRRGLVTLTIGVPAAGGVKAELTARAGRPRKPRTLATSTDRAAERAELEMALRPVRRYRSELRRRGRIKGRVRVDFVASSGGRQLSASRAVRLVQRAGGGPKGGKGS